MFMSPSSVLGNIFKAPTIVSFQTASQMFTTRDVNPPGKQVSLHSTAVWFSITSDLMPPNFQIRLQAQG